ncbi:unnamed protein product [Withania somnifera]
MRIAGSKEHSFAAYPFYKRTVQPVRRSTYYSLALYLKRCASSGVIKKNHTPLTVSPSLNHRATLGFFPPDINEVGGKDRAQLIIYGYGYSLSF